jgi:hypothetical protein
MTVRPALTSGDRGASTVLSYVLTVAVTSILVGLLIIAGSSFVDNQQQLAVEQELTVIGNQIAGDLEQADRLVRASRSDAPTVMINESFQGHVSGVPYSITLESTDPPQIVLQTANPDVSVAINATVRTDISESAIAGGPVSVYFDPSLGSNGRLVITDA